MRIPVKVGESTTIVDPVTGGFVKVTVTAVEGGQISIRVVAPSDVRVAKLGDDVPPTLH